MPSPLCRCRVLYIGSAVPTVTKDGLQGIQEPLRERYPVDHNSDTKGIDSWLSVWSNGLLLEYIEGNRKTEASFFPISTLHYCAAVRYVNVSGYEVEGGGERFLPLDSPFANLPNSQDPPIFAAILRRTTGIKVLECHAFICTNAKAANALVRCCFHAYADSMYVKMDDRSMKDSGIKAIKDKESSRSSTPKSDPAENGYNGGAEDNLSEGDILRFTGDNKITKPNWQSRQQSGDYETASISSSLAGRYRKKETGGTMTRPPRASSELGGTSLSTGRAVVPVGHLDWRQRRANSELNIHAAAMGGGGTMPRGGAPMPFMNGSVSPPVMMFGPEGPMGPMPPEMMGGPGFRQMGPEIMIRPPVGPPPGPIFPGHPMMTGPQPPHMMQGGPIMIGPEGPMPVPMGMGPIPIGMDPRGGPFFDPMLRNGGPVPIVMHPEDSPFGTLRRQQNGRFFEEPVYMPGSMPGPPPPHMIPPEASYHPSAFPPEQYDAYYDSYLGASGRGSRSSRPSKGRKGPGSTASSRQRSEIGVQEPSYWENNNIYESGGIFRKPYLNEKAFITSIERETTERPDYADPRMGNGHGPLRPATPPADYDSPRMGYSRNLEEAVTRMNISDVDDRSYRMRESNRAQVMY